MLEIQSLCVTYGDKPVLKDISLSVRPGEVLAVIGPNGAGKTTLLRAASGVLLPDQGAVFLDGADMRQFPPEQRARRLAVVPQARSLPPAFTVYQTVLLGRTPYLGWLGQARAQDHAQARQALEHTDLLDLAERRVGALSGGEQQRVLLARALAQDTPILLLDEPTTHLDLQHQSRLLNLVRQLADRRKLAVLLVLHDLNLAALYADRLALLVDGRILATGDPHSVLTEQNLSTVYQVPVQVMTHPAYGTPLILPDGRQGLQSGSTDHRL